jgi:DNA-binding CsgD family transcriptional regulator
MTANGAELTLTRRENEVAELFAWGASKKEVADRLYISQRTVENHSRSIYEKTGCGKVNELSAWWFCTTFRIPFDLSPLKRRVVSLVLLLVLLPGIRQGNETVRLFRAQARTAGTGTVRGRRNEVFDFDYLA